MGGIHLTGIEYFLPATALTNEDLSKKFGTPPAEIFKKTGISQRYQTSPDFTMSHMAAMAAEQLFRGHDRNTIDALILVGHGFNFKAPNTSVVLQDKLSLRTSILAIDMPHGCTGYINGLAVSTAVLKSGIAKKVLLLTGDTPSYVINPKNEELLSIFSDSGTATLVELNSAGRDEQYIFGSDGQGAEALIVKRSGTTHPLDLEYLQESGMIYGEMEMKSTDVFLFAIRTVPQLIKDTLEKNNLLPDHIDLYVFHQANGFLLETLRKKLKISPDKFVNDIKDTGNTVSSSIPIALKNAERSGRLKRGMKVLLAGFGIGYTWGATVITY